MSSPTMPKKRDAPTAREEQDDTSSVPPDQVISLEAAAVLGRLESSPRGLEDQEASRRRNVYGPNPLPPSRGRSVLRELADQLTNMFAVVLIVSAGLTVLTYLLTSPRDVANLELTFGILAVVVLNPLIGFAQEHAAERTSEALQAMVPHSAKVLRGGQLTEVASADLVVGDVVVFEAGDAVSADRGDIEAHELSTEMAALTGESQPVGRDSDPVASGTPVVEAKNGVFMGASVTEGAGKAVVFATGIHTEFGRIYRLTAGLPTEQSPLQRQINQIARRIAVIGIAAGVVLFTLRVLTGNAAAASFVFALAVIVALVYDHRP